MIFKCSQLFLANYCESRLDHKNVCLLRDSELAGGETKATIHSGTKSAI